MANINGYNSQTGEWNDSLTGDFIWSNVNVGEAVSDVMTPLTWSIFSHSFGDLTFIPGYNVVGNICGRIYNNVSLTIALLRLSGRNPRLERAAAAVRLREAVRSEFMRITTVTHPMSLKAGEMLGIGNDVFFLTFQEIWGLLRGVTADALQHIPARKSAYERQRSMPPYPPVIRGHFDPVKWLADPNRRRDYFDSHEIETSMREPRSAVIKGMPGSAGQVEGRVRRVDKVEAGDQLQQGEILVTTQTNIGWTPIFPRAAAVVTDVGAPLSHAAIVARELGIPAVVGCRDATMRLETGDRVRVDGSAGTVEILK